MALSSRSRRPHQQDFIETVSGLANEGRQKFALRLSAWEDEHEPSLPPGNDLVAAMPKIDEKRVRNSDLNFEER
jgi:hypothetical protein